MKKKYFHPSLLDQNHLPKMVSRRIFGTSRTGAFRSSAYKTDANSDDDDDGEAEALMTRIKSVIKKEVGTRAKADELKAIQDEFVALFGKPAEGETRTALPLEALRAMADEKTGVMAKLVEQGLKIKEMETAATSNVKELDVRSQVAQWHTDNKANIEKFKSGEIKALPTLEIRAAANPMTVATVNSGTSPFIGSRQVEAGVNDYLKPQLTFWDTVIKGRTGAATYYWANKTNPQGAAAFIGPGVYKPNVSFEIVVESSNAKKIADSAKCTTELLDDIDGMTTFIEQELKWQVMLKLNTTLMTGVSSSTVPAGIQTLSVAYTLTSVKTTDPTYIDAIRAVVAQMRSGNLTGDITVYINSIDGANMDLAKANNSGVYLLPPFVTSDGRKIAGATIVEDNNVPVGYVQAAFMQYYRILIYKDYSVKWGWENDDFTKNLVTAVGEMRLHQFFNSIYTGAFVYDTFDNIVAAIKQV